jgi:hypothetical protein
MAAADTSTDDGDGDGEGGWGAAGRGSRPGSSGRPRGRGPTALEGGRGPGTATGGGTALAGRTGDAGSPSSLPRGRAAEGTRPKPSASRASSLTTAESPMRMKPPVRAVAPPTIKAVPRANSLSGIPNPMAATPHAATRIPKTNNSTDITLRPRRQRHAPQQAQPLWLPNNFGPVLLHPQ